MCKVIAVTDGSNIKDFDAFVKVCINAVKDQRDGFGFAALGTNGVFGYRTTVPNMGYIKRELPTWCESAGEKYGAKESAIVGPVILHGRVSTNVKNLANTHPIVKNNWHLIHNGVVTHHGAAYTRLTQNDSEHVLHNLMTGGIKAVADNLTGYYAFAAIDDSGNLHVGRDKTAPLFYAYFKTISSGVFATTIDILAALAEHLGEDEDTLVSPVKDDIYMIFKGSELAHTSRFESLGWGIEESKHASASLGYDIDQDYNSRYGSSYAHRFNDDGGWDDKYKCTDDDADDYLNPWEEIENMDGTYTIYAPSGKEISIKTFNQLSDTMKVRCSIMRENGDFVELAMPRIKRIS